MSSTLAGLGAREQRRIVARLAASLGLKHLALAEDAFQTALLRALQTWPTQGEPEKPVAWLYVVARRAALDVLRAEQALQALPEEDDHTPLDSLLSTPAPEGRFAGELDDDELALLFAACDPGLPEATQVALGLRSLAGLELADVASAMLSTEAAVAQRLARARGLLAGTALQVPAGRELPERLDQVPTVLSLMFLAGLRAHARLGVADTTAGDAMRQVCWEAIRLARALASHTATRHPDCEALAAMLLLHGARLTGRLDDQGEIVPLPGQDRDRWDVGMIQLGLHHLRAAQRASHLSRWHLLAGIAAEHAIAADYASTDWACIETYYGMLLELDPSAVPTLGHAIALVESGQAEQGLVCLQALLTSVPSALKAHTLAALARAEERLGRKQQACQLLVEAISAAPRPADARMLQRRLEALRAA